MLRLAVLFGTLALVSMAPSQITNDDDDLLIEFVKYKLEFGKKYLSDEEDQKRFKIFSRMHNKIQAHNKNYEAGLETFEMGWTKFTDQEPEEYKSYFMCLKKLDEAKEAEAATFLPPENVVLPASVDWRTKGYVTPVKDQGFCGSCWAFSATGSLEGQHFKKNGTLVSLSEQNLVDCVTADDGCEGGLMHDAFQYIKKNKGIDTEKSYPYTGEDGKCHYSAKNKGATDVGYTAIKKGSEKDLQQAVATVGPISIAINAALDSFANYKKGLYKVKNCPGERDDLDHGVLAVGYGTLNSTGLEGGKKKKGPYWIVKNSWGKDWGMNGYILMARNYNNMCGIATQASYPNV